MPLFGRIFGNNNNTRSSSTSVSSTSNRNEAPPSASSSSSVSRSVYPGQRMQQSRTVTTIPPSFTGNVNMNVNANQTSSMMNNSHTNTMINQQPTAPAPVPSNHNQNQIHLGLNNTATPQPGAYRVERNPGTEYRVTIPNGVMPGQMFQVMAGNQLVRVRCPNNTTPGGTLSITLPGAPNPEQVSNQRFVSHAGQQQQQGPLFSNHVGSQQRPTPLFSNSNQRQHQQQQQQQHRTHFVTVPHNVQPGQSFYAFVDGRRVQVTCPPNVSGGMQVRINIPSQEVQIPPPSNFQSNPPPVSPPQQQMRSFEVTLPPGVGPGQPFGLMAGGRRVIVTAPPNVAPGSRIRFQLPISATSMENITAIQLSYGEGTGWTRALKPQSNGRAEFQWKNLDNISEAEQSFVRQMHYYTPPGEQHRTAYVSFMPAQEAVIPGSVYDDTNSRVLIGYQDIISVQSKKLDEKATWLQHVCKTKLSVDYTQGHMEIQVRRDFLLGDSVAAIMSLSRVDLRKTFRFSFWGEAGIDAGGLMREWFQLVTEEIFNPDFGLFKYSSHNQMCFMINPLSEVSHPDEHLTYFRFLGRVLGKALFERVLVRGHLVRHLYKHFLGFPVNIDDIEMVDTLLFKSLEQLKDYKANGGDVEDLCLDFSVSEEFLGVITTKELIENGAEVTVTNNNLDEYLDAIIKYQLMERTRPQLAEMLLGFYDVVDEGLLTILDFQELELLLCGLPEIDLNDWKCNTDYTGNFEHGDDNSVIAWFWDVVEHEFDQEMRARLLQFVTGTAGVPAQGFSVLQGNDGNIRKFCIHGVYLDTCFFPRAHTCFNRLDLPLYSSKEQLSEKLTLAVQMEATGFGLE